MRGQIMIGVVLMLIGISAYAVPIFTTQQTKEVARIGDLKIETNEATTHAIPPLLSGGAVLLGAVLIGAGLYRRPPV